MKDPELVFECINEMVNSCKIPVTAKTRIGFDDTEDFDYLNKFILKMKGAGCTSFIIHARKAILKGLSPKQNLNIPKLNYDMVYKVKKENIFVIGLGQMGKSFINLNVPSWFSGESLYILGTRCCESTHLFFIESLESLP